MAMTPGPVWKGNSPNLQCGVHDQTNFQTWPDLNKSTKKDCVHRFKVYERSKPLQVVCHSALVLALSLMTPSPIGCCKKANFDRVEVWVIYHVHTERLVMLKCHGSCILLLLTTATDNTALQLR